MFHIIKHESQYLWGSDGHLHAVLAFDTATKRVVAFANWGGVVKNGRYYPSNYACPEFKSFKEAVAYMKAECRR